MLDAETKRRIDTARDILVGKVPDPKSQVEQITIALIYKFMDDIDAQSEELGGERSFFAGEFARYGWTALMRSGLGGHEALSLYAEAIIRMPENPGIPPLFRDIFDNAYLPYRDPETLRAFLKVIDEFEYDHSERLGDAFEYLLSVMGSQGDAGQFRTPRHIIDFIVAVIDPRKHETVLDPACGTAGFLISAYKHILAANTIPPPVNTIPPPVNTIPPLVNPNPPVRGEPVEPQREAAGDGESLPAIQNPQSSILDPKSAVQNPQSTILDPKSAIQNPQSTLTPDEKGRLAANFSGYDISPDMVRLSLVNMYLHRFAAPRIYEYDTLTSKDRWDEYADVILANPPFMSPKGGIRPHNRFSVKSRRSEVLFVDYMAGHLTPGGRAGIIVPEGVIFQSQKAHTQLRKLLVEDYLVAVVSLPAGVFKPYSGVKASILILDRALARHTDSIAFFKVENDGFDLGDQRRPIDRNDLPQVQSEIVEYLRRLRSGKSLDDFDPALGLIVEKARIAADGDYNLTGERYRHTETVSGSHPMVSVQTVASVESGFRFPLEYQGKADQEIPFLKVSDMNLPGNETRITSWNNTVSRDDIQELRAKVVPAGTVIFPKIGAAIATNKKRILTRESTYDNNVMGIVPDSDRIVPQFLHALLIAFDISAWASDAQPPSMRKTVVQRYNIPLPPLEVQREIVAEIEGYQKVIDGARAVIDNYRPHIPIDPEWPTVRLSELCQINPDSVVPASAYPDQTIFYIDISSIENGTGRFLGYTEVLSSEAPSRARRGVRSDDVLLSTVRPNLKAFTLLRTVNKRAIASTGFAVLRARPGFADPAFIHASICLDRSVSQMIAMMEKSSYPSINQSDVASIRISLPPLVVQQEIVNGIETERAAVNANIGLVDRFEQKIHAAIGRVWGEESQGRLAEAQ